MLWSTAEVNSVDYFGDGYVETGKFKTCTVDIIELDDFFGAFSLDLHMVTKV